MAAVAFGKIVAVQDDREAANQQAILARLTEALQSILDGENPDEALALQRQKGPAANPETLHLAMLMEIARQRGDNWSTIEHLVNDLLLPRSGRAPLSPARLKNIHGTNKTEAQRLLRSVRALRKGAEQGVFERISTEAAKLMLAVRNLERFVADPDSVSIARDKT